MLTPRQRLPRCSRAVWRSRPGGTLGVPAKKKDMSVQDVASFDPIQANDIDAELERSLTNEWDAKIMTYPNERFPFNEWIRNRIRMMGFPVEDLSYFHEVVPQSETYRVTKQLCADTNLPEFRRMLNGFVRHVVVPKGKLRQPVEVES